MVANDTLFTDQDTPPRDNPFADARVKAQFARPTPDAQRWLDEHPEEAAKAEGYVPQTLVPFGEERIKQMIAEKSPPPGMTAKPTIHPARPSAHEPRLRCDRVLSVEWLWGAALGANKGYTLYRDAFGPITTADTPLVKDALPRHILDRADRISVDWFVYWKFDRGAQVVLWVFDNARDNDYAWQYDTNIYPMEGEVKKIGEAVKDVVKDVEAKHAEHVANRPPSEWETFDQDAVPAEAEPVLPWGDDNHLRSVFFGRYEFEVWSKRACPRDRAEAIRQEVLKREYKTDSLQGFNAPVDELLAKLTDAVEVEYPLALASKNANASDMPKTASETPPVASKPSEGVPASAESVPSKSEPQSVPGTGNAAPVVKPDETTKADPSTGEIVVYDATRAIERMMQRSDIMTGIRKSGILKPGIDYGTIPGTNDKNVLLKPGAEKLCSAYGLCPEFHIADKVVSWSADAPMFYFQYECRLVDITTGKTVATGIGSCNSMESKYRYRWVYDNEAKALGLDLSKLVKKEYTSKAGKRYFKYRVDNENPFELVNTIDKMAQKRALIAATLIGANASDQFTQDIETMPDFGYIDAEIIEAA